MKLYSWNMYFRNGELDRAFAFIQSLDFDILCLQEVPEVFLERLRELGLQFAYTKELDFIDDQVEQAYCVILSKHRIVQSHDFALPKYIQPFRTKAFIALMHVWGWRRSTGRRCLFADIELPGLLRTRVFCLHLTLSHPHQRAAEFGAAMARRGESTPTIVCGDLNILESPRVILLNWLLGGRSREIFTIRNERRDIERTFAELKLQNPLRGKPTQTISHSQLDHILVPNNFSVTKAQVLRDRVGSDHHPIFVECE